MKPVFIKLGHYCSSPNKRYYYITAQFKVVVFIFCNTEQWYLEYLIMFSTQLLFGQSKCMRFRLNIVMVLVMTEWVWSLLFLVSVGPMTLRWTRGSPVWFPHSSHAATFLQSIHHCHTYIVKYKSGKVFICVPACMLQAATEKNGLNILCTFAQSKGGRQLL